ncbi:hypothetical protein K0M31_017016 [Melipona bicolor]|uniref:Uncharacterized protein n=1 Tax=Melipona bicolor TaxID=60889 RepID=A0AA40FDN7_9HYME|nr:hypothetical protein K0M31_017016 [Melipona bicolor]
MGQETVIEGDLRAAAGRSGTYFVAKTHAIRNGSWLELRPTWNGPTRLNSVHVLLLSYVISYRIVCIDAFSFSARNAEKRGSSIESNRAKPSVFAETDYREQSFLP